MNNIILFSKDHLWILKEDTSVKIGLSDYAQKSMKSVLFINLPDEGDALSVGEAFGDVESIKKVSELISPINGTVTAVNEELTDEPERINESPYDCWLIEAAADSFSDGLMDESAYLKYIGQ